MPRNKRKGRFVRGGNIRTRGPPCCLRAARMGCTNGPCKKFCKKVNGRYPEWGGGFTWVILTTSGWLQSQNNYLNASNHHA